MRRRVRTGPVRKPRLLVLAGGLAGLFVVLVSAAAPTATPGVEAAQAPAGCTLAPEFRALRAAIPSSVGECVEPARVDPATGDLRQRTTGGLLAWRRAVGLASFTDGATTWVLGPDGLRSRPNSAPPFPFEATPAAGDTATRAPSTPSSVATRGPTAAAAPPPSKPRSPPRPAPAPSPAAPAPPPPRTATAVVGAGPPMTAAPAPTSAVAPAAPAPAAPAAKPAASGDPAQTWLAAARQALQELPLGTMLFNPPAEMTVGKKERIELRITREQGSVDLGAGLQGRGEPQQESLKVSPFMVARLTADSREFSITPIGPEEQFIDDIGYGEWGWDVVPNEAGEHSLFLQVSAKVRADPNDPGLSKAYPVIDRRVAVRISPLHVAAEALRSKWAEILGTMVVPILAVYLGYKLATREGTKKGRGKVARGRPQR